MKPHIDLANAFIRELKLHGTAIIDNKAKTLPQNTQTRTIPNTNMIFDPTSHIANLKIKAYCDKMNQELKTRLLQGKRTAPTYSRKGSPTSKHRVGGGGIATHHRKNSHLTTTHNPTIIQSVFDPLQKAHHARTVQ